MINRLFFENCFYLIYNCKKLAIDGLKIAKKDFDYVVYMLASLIFFSGQKLRALLSDNILFLLKDFGKNLLLYLH